MTRMKRKNRKLVWVNVYTINRCYGGHEEGGWWFDWWTFKHGISTTPRRAERLKVRLERRFNHIAWGDINSVLDGQDVAVCINESRAEWETTTRPYYC